MFTSSAKAMSGAGDEQKEKQVGTGREAEKDQSAGCGGGGHLEARWATWTPDSRATACLLLPLLSGCRLFKKMHKVRL